MYSFSPGDIHFVSQLSSTNTQLHDRWKQEHELREAYALACFDQTDGRGQQHNTWEAEAGKNIAYSVFLRPGHISPNRSFVLSQAVSLALVDLLNNRLNLNASIKWPNDIYVQHKKIAGILIENELRGKTILGSIVGIGLNINQEVFTTKAPNPVSIIQLCQKAQDLRELSLALHKHIGIEYNKTYNTEGQADIAERYHQQLYRKDGFHYYKEGDLIFSASIVQVLPSGHLELEMKDGKIKRFAFKEIEYLI